MHRYKILSLLIVLIFLVSCGPNLEGDLAPYSSFVLSETEDGVKEMVLVTGEGIKLRATDYGGDFNQKIILLHMLDGDRHDYSALAQLLKNNNFRVLSLDFKGHGESDLYWKDFEDRYFIELVEDVNTAHKYFKDESNAKVSIIGGSIGANIALNYANQFEGVDKLILLSPGEEYRSVYAEIENNVPTMLVSTTGDTYSFKTVTTLKDDVYVGSKTFIYAGNAHGTNILKSNPELNQEIVDFIRE
jgi:predicted alpha/beta-fold hydrolase